MFSEIYSILSFCVEQYGELVKWRGAGNSLKSGARALSPKQVFVRSLASIHIATDEKQREKHRTLK